MLRRGQVALQGTGGLSTSSRVSLLRLRRPSRFSSTRRIGRCPSHEVRALPDKIRFALGDAEGDQVTFKPQRNPEATRFGRALAPVWEALAPLLHAFRATDQVKLVTDPRRGLMRIISPGKFGGFAKLPQILTAVPPGSRSACQLSKSSGWRRSLGRLLWVALTAQRRERYRECRRCRWEGSRRCMQRIRRLRALSARVHYCWGVVILPARECKRKGGTIVLIRRSFLNEAVSAVSQPIEPGRSLRVMLDFVEGPSNIAAVHGSGSWAAVAVAASRFGHARRVTSGVKARLG